MIGLSSAVRGAARTWFASATLAALFALTADAAVAAAQARPPRKPLPDLTALDIEQLMQLEVVFAASKRNQNPREVASVVTVVTAAQIRQHGHRTLADILRTVPSFYITSDRGYSYVGVRGFGQPGDFSSRILLLVNGLRTNDNIYDMAMVGEEFGIAVDLIDRVEVVRGPSGAVYGSSAFFAVINVVTKHGADVDGTEVSADAGSFGRHAGAATFGKKLENGVDVLLSGSLMKSAGQSRLYYAEYDDSTTNYGIADNVDGESSQKVFASLAKGGFSIGASHSSRDKTVPTGSYGTLFNDSRTTTVDQITLGSLSYARESILGSVSTRLHAGRAHYHGHYAYDPAEPPNYDALNGKWWGLDVDGSRTVLTRHTLTGGLEYRDNFQQDQVNYYPEPFVSVTDVRRQSQRLGGFAQDEVRLSQSLILYAGLRYDWFETFGTAASPRVGLIFNPGEATTVKLLLGSAFRAPNEYELHFQSSWFKVNPDLGPERIKTVELATERRVGSDLLVTASAFRNTITALITLQEDPSDSLLVFRNIGRIDSDGLELALSWNRGRGITGDLSVALQKTRDHETGVRLTNSPMNMSKLRIVAPFTTALSAGLAVQYVGARKTLAADEAKAFTITNLTLLAPELFRRVEMSASVNNLFGVRYGYPGSEEHAQDIIQQDGRSVRVKATFRY